MTDPFLAQLPEVLARYGLAVVAGTEPVRAGSGFSGADVGRVSTSLGPLCVRRWPAEHPTPAALRRIHQVQQRAVAAGCRFVPNPLPARDGNTVALHAGRLWEVSPWLSGMPDTSPKLSEARRSALWRALASFHRAVTPDAANLQRGRSPGMADRLRRIEAALDKQCALLAAAALPPEWGALGPRRDAFLPLFRRGAARVQRLLTEAAEDTAPLIPCLRDIRREHVLFEGDEVGGWVDFGGVELEHRAADAARVLGEFCAQERERWEAMLAAYDEAYGGAQGEPCSRRAVAAFDASTSLLAPLNWLRWILLERRDFADRVAVLVRFDELSARLRRQIETADAAAAAKETPGG